jgi:hypothetical protein
MNKAMRTTEIDEWVQAGIGEAIHALKPSGAVFRHLENADDETSGRNNLGTLLGQVRGLLDNFAWVASFEGCFLRST